MKDRIAAARLLIDNNLQDGENPVAKVAVAVHSGAGGQVLMTELTPMVTDGDNSNLVENNINNIRGEGESLEIRVLHSKMQEISQQNSALLNELEVFKSTTNDILTKMNASMYRISQSPV